MRINYTLLEVILLLTVRSSITALPLCVWRVKYYFPYTKYSKIYSVSISYPCSSAVFLSFHVFDSCQSDVINNNYETHCQAQEQMLKAKRAKSANYGSVRGSRNGPIGNFTNGTIGSQWHHWLTNGTIGLPMVPTVPLGEQMVPLALPLVPMVFPMVPLV